VVVLARVQVAIEVSGDGLQVHEVAEPSSCAFPHLILPAAGLPKVSDGRQLCVDGQSVVPPVVERRHCLLRTLLIIELDVYVPHQMIP
jgi:hypothetical protein